VLFVDIAEFAVLRLFRGRLDSELSPNGFVDWMVQSFSPAETGVSCGAASGVARYVAPDNLIASDYLYSTARTQAQN